jgi:predicted amidophosphoribosyltransferase
VGDTPNPRERAREPGGAAGGALGARTDLAPASVRAISDAYAAIMHSPARPAAGVCATCRGFAVAGARECSSCQRLPRRLDLVVPVSYSAGGGALHRELRGYKDDRSEVARDVFTRGLAAVLWRYLAEHERCVARAANVTRFDLVTSVPSRTRRDDDTRRRLRLIIGSACGPTTARYVRALVPTDRPGEAHRWTPERYRAVRCVRGADVLLIDDTWASGASAQAAAHALKRARAHRVALVVLGRHVNPQHADHAARLGALPAFDWADCAVCAGEPSRTAGASAALP